MVKTTEKDSKKGEIKQGQTVSEVKAEMAAVKNELAVEEDEDNTVLTMLPLGLFSIWEDLKPGGRTLEKIAANGTLLGVLWLLALLLFGFGDTLTSIMVFNQGGYEANPILAWIVSVFGGGIIVFVIVKTVVLGLLAIISYIWFTAYSWLIPTILIAMGTYLVTNNLLWLMVR